MIRVGTNRDDHTGPTTSAAKAPDFAALVRPITHAADAVKATSDPMRAYEEATALASRLRLMAVEAARLRRRIIQRERANGSTGRALATLYRLTPARVSQLGRTPRKGDQS